MLDEAPEADAVEQQQPPSDAAPATTQPSPTGATNADAQEQQQSD
jgi:hypothetical protein